MDTRDGASARFIQTFARNTAEGKAAELIAQFADSFLFAGPAGSQWVRACDFAMALPKRRQFFEKFGHRATELADVRETRLDDRYALVHSRWRFTFEPAENAPFTLDTESSFLVDAGAEPFRILMYLAHEDILEILQKRTATHANA